MATMFKPGESGAVRAAPSWLVSLHERGGGFRPDGRFSGDALVAPQPDNLRAEEDAAHEAQRSLREAFDAGLAQGHSDAREQVAAERAAHNKLRLSIARLDEASRRELADKLAQTVTALCEATLGPLALDRDALQRRCLIAAGTLGETQDVLELHLHPEDIFSLDPAFAAGWTIVPAPHFERGTIRIEGAEAGVTDGPQEWRAALEAAFAC